MPFDLTRKETGARQCHVLRASLRVFRAIPNLTIRYNANFVCWATGEAGVRANTFHHSPRRVYYAAESRTALCECGLPWAISNIRISCVQVVCAIASSPSLSLPDAREKFPGRFQIFRPRLCHAPRCFATADPSYRLLPRYQRATLAHANDHSRRSRAEIGECGVVQHGRRILIQGPGDT